MGMNRKQPQHEAPAPDDATREQERTRATLVERLFREHNEALVRFLFARLRSQQAAREVAQEAYVRLLSLDEPGAVSYLRAFLFKTAANLAVDRLRRNDVRTRAAEATLFSQLSDPCTPERQLAAKQSIERLNRLVAAMPASCR